MFADLRRSIGGGGGRTADVPPVGGPPEALPGVFGGRTYQGDEALRAVSAAVPARGGFALGSAGRDRVEVPQRCACAPSSRPMRRARTSSGSLIEVVHRAGLRECGPRPRADDPFLCRSLSVGMSFEGVPATIVAP